MNKRCPACSTNNHDSKGDHLFLLKDGETWGCFHKEYHSDGKNYLEGKGSKPCSLPGQRLTTGRETVEEILSYPYLKGEFRGIRGDIYQLYQARISFDEATGSPSTLYFPIHSKGKLIGFHCRNLKEKSFYNIGSIAGQDLDLFGIDKCAKTGKNIVVTEGHIDTLSVYQAVKDRYPKINPNIVSLNNGIGSLKDMVSSVQDLNAYDQVLLCFDMDQPGREGIAKASKLLGGGKIRVMELSEKDANDCLVKGKQAEIINAIFNPKEYIPSDIVTLSDIHEAILTETPYGIPYPWEGLNEITYGIFSQQIISIGAAAGAGKALMHGEFVLTLNGKVKIEDLKVGDGVLNTKGRASTIKGVYPQGVRPIYEVSFTDGTSLKVDEDHLWTLVKTKDKKRVTIKTKDLLRSYLQGSSKRKVFYLPSYSPVEYEEKIFKINPYLLGCWLGDGTTKSGCINCPRGKIDESCLLNYEFTYSDKYNQYRVKKLKGVLRELNLLSNKHIPEDYFYGSEDQRRALLKGLLDTDGSDSGRKGYYFDNTIESLVDGVVQLARSLGLIAKKIKMRESPYYKDKNGNKVFCKPCYRCVIKVEGGRTSKRYVEDVSYIGEHYATCISVDSDDHLFLAEDYIPTHNTVFMNQLSAYLIKTFKKKIALFSLEETPAYTAKKLIGSLIQKRIHLPGVTVDPEEIKDVYEELKNYLYIYDTQGFLSWEDIKANIRYLATLGVEMFIIDPLTAVTAMYSASEANEILNGMMADLSTLVQSLNVTVFLVSHLNNPKTGKMHTEGGRVSGEQFTQSRALQRWSHLILGLERDLQSEDEEEKNTLVVRVIKNRLVGKTGTVDLMYDVDTGRLKEKEISYGIV